MDVEVSLPRSLLLSQHALLLRVTWRSRCTACLRGGSCRAPGALPRRGEVLLACGHLGEVHSQKSVTRNLWERVTFWVWIYFLLSFSIYSNLRSQPLFALHTCIYPAVSRVGEIHPAWLSMVTEAISSSRFVADVCCLSCVLVDPISWDTLKTTVFSVAADSRVLRPDFPN